MIGIDFWEAATLGMTFAPVLLIVALLVAFLWKFPTKLLRKIRRSRNIDSEIEKLRRKQREAGERN